MSEQTKITENTINSFSWDDSVSEIDFFGETTLNPNKVKVEDLDRTPKEPEGKTESAKEKEEEKVEIDFFGEKGGEATPEPKQPEKEEEEEEEKKRETEATAVTSNIGALNFLKEKGFINFELEEGEELDEEEAGLLLEDKFEESLEAKFEASIANLPDIVKNIVRYANQGGDVEEMLSKMSQPRVEGISKTLDLEKEDNQEKMVRFQLAKEGYDNEYIDTHIEVLKDSNKLKTIAEKHFDKWKKEDAKAEEEYIEKQKQAKVQAKQQQLNYKKEIQNHLSETESINNLKFSKNDAKDLPDYIANTSVQLQDGRQITPFYRDLFESMKDKDKLLVLAKLVKNNFDFKDIEKEVATRQARKLKDDLERQEQKQAMKSAGGSSQPKRLADYL